MQSVALPLFPRSSGNKVAVLPASTAKAVSPDPVSFVPRVARAAGLSGRYRYWLGGSGQSYLFTRLDVSALADFPHALVLLARAGMIVRVGEASEISSEAAFQVTANEPGMICYVHLLADTPARRQAVAEDLAASAAIAPDDEGNVTILRPAA